MAQHVETSMWPTTYLRSGGEDNPPMVAPAWICLPIAQLGCELIPRLIDIGCTNGNWRSAVRNVPSM